MAGWVTGGYPGGSVQVETGDEFPWKQAICKLVLHSTETAGFPDYPANKAPNATVNPRARQWRQHRSFDKPSWALKAGAVSTNSMGCVQIEIVGYAASLKDLSGGDLDYLLGFLRFVLDQTGIPIQCSVLFGGSETAGVGGTQRMTAAQWVAYRGICGHQHVPINDHWDPGDLPMQAVWLPRLKGQSPATPEPAPVILEDDMFMIAATNRGIALFGAGYFQSLSQPQVNLLQTVQPPVVVTWKTDAEFDLLQAACIGGTDVTNTVNTLKEIQKQSTIAATREVPVDTTGLTVDATVSTADKKEIIDGSVAGVKNLTLGYK